jgi:hypothetical protein
MSHCSSCGRGLPGEEHLCRECYLAQYEALSAPKSNSVFGWSTYPYLALWIFASYLFFTYTPDLVRVVVLGLSLVIIWGLFLWAISQKPRKRYATVPEGISFYLALGCGVVWKITGSGTWARLGMACVLVSAGYKAVDRLIDLAKTERR